MKQKKGFRSIPGIGKNLEQHLFALGYQSVSDLKGQNPDDMYVQDCARLGCPIDRCALYVYRLAVYYAETPVPDANKLKWWYWKSPKPEDLDAFQYTCQNTNQGTTKPC